MKTAEERIHCSYIYAVRVINQQIWCCCSSDGIVVFGNEQYTIPRGEMGKVYDVAQMSNRDVVIASDSGLYHAEVTGESQRLTNHVTKFYHACGL